MSKKIAYKGKLVVTKCWCGIRHAIPVELDEEQGRQHDDGEPQTPICCPLGHARVRKSVR